MCFATVPKLQLLLRHIITIKPLYSHGWKLLLCASGYFIVIKKLCEPEQTDFLFDYRRSAQPLQTTAHYLSIFTLWHNTGLLQMPFALGSCHTWEKNYTCSVVVRVWYGINILCIGHFTPPVDLSDRPFKTERDWLSLSARHQRETTLLIYLKSTGRYEKPIAYMFSFLLAVFMSYTQWR